MRIAAPIASVAQTHETMVKQCMEFSYLLLAHTTIQLELRAPPMVFAFGLFVAATGGDFYLSAACIGTWALHGPTLIDEQAQITRQGGCVDAHRSGKFTGCDRAQKN